jgi:predicted ATPase
MLINSIKLINLLSFSNSDVIELKPINVIIGPNGSGKSNFLEAFGLLKNLPGQLQKTFHETGGVNDWLWKGANETPIVGVEAVIDYPNSPNTDLRYFLGFTIRNHRFFMVDESIEDAKPQKDCETSKWYYQFNDREPRAKSKDNIRTLTSIDPERSILAQLRDPDMYPEITHLGDTLSHIKLYDKWGIGQNCLPRHPQKADLPNDFLDEDCSNLGLVLNRLRQIPQVKQRILSALQELFDGIDDYDVQVIAGYVQVVIQEHGFTIPATRLSDGTLHYLCLLAILCHPTPPPLICIEEPELGLHPDILPTLAELLKEASTRCQLIVTTHSDILVDAMTDQPESILVCEKGESGTELSRLSAEKLKPWLEKYRLGELWISGELGGKRW